MKIILALTSLLAASAINLATIHDSSAETFVVFLHGADAAETALSVESGLTATVCAAKASHVWEAAHVADIAALDAACLPDHPRLVGYGCKGAAAPLYANAEDDFPLCDRIEATR